MLKNVKRVLALTAVAPLAMVAMAGSASAATDFAMPTQTGNVLTATCEHPDGMLVQTIITLEGDGTGSDDNDIERVRVRATDNQGLNAYDDNDVKVQKIRVRYFHENDVEGYYGIDGFPDARYSKTSDSSDTRTGGVKVFKHENDNIGLVEVKVSWKVNGDKETLVCHVRVGDDLILP